MTKMTVHDIPSTYPVASSSSYPVGPSGLSRVASYKLSVGGGFDLNGILINKIDIQITESIETQCQFIGGFPISS